MEDEQRSGAAVWLLLALLAVGLGIVLLAGMGS
jgi:hypothetical protein